MCLQSLTNVSFKIERILLRFHNICVFWAVVFDSLLCVNRALHATNHRRGLYYAKDILP